jgi:DNA-binding MarR family transcriptional regulator
MPNDGDDVRVMNALRRLMSALRSSGAAASSEAGMSVAQLFALRSIGQEPGLSMTDLAARTLTTASAVSEVVAKLVARGLVRREPDPSDRRRLLLHLTPDGLACCERLEQTLPERLVAALAAMDAVTRRVLAGALEQWVEDAGLGGTTPSMFGEPGPASSVVAPGRAAPDTTPGTAPSPHP